MANFRLGMANLRPVLANLRSERVNLRLNWFSSIFYIIFTADVIKL